MPITAESRERCTSASTISIPADAPRARARFAKRIGSTRRSGDYRPGRVAAKQFGVRSPLDEAGITKDEIREQSRLAGLPVWDEPASACLSSRIPYHHEVTPEKLRQIERGEDALHVLGFRVCRVRHHDTRARGSSRRGSPAALDPRCQPSCESCKGVGYSR